uniref:Uncharacterized protein n=1 Tax=Octopus bimaculoides TaxID=37653 RepID=A0A0L8GAH0_OCTBM
MVTPHIVISMSRENNYIYMEHKVQPTITLDNINEPMTKPKATMPGMGNSLSAKEI